MKSAFFLLLFLGALSSQAQVGTSPRTLTKRIEPLVRPQPPRSYGAPQPAVSAGTNVAKPLTAKELEQKKMELDAEAKKKLQWQMERAEKGSDSAQYTVAVRYLNGDGVPKDLEKAKKLLQDSAKQGNADAKKKLAELDEKK